MKQKSEPEPSASDDERVDNVLDEPVPNPHYAGMASREVVLYPAKSDQEKADPPPDESLTASYSLVHKSIIFLPSQSL